MKKKRITTGVVRKLAKKTARKAARKTAKKATKKTAKKTAKKPSRKVTRKAKQPSIGQLPDESREGPPAKASGELSTPSDLKKGKRPILVPVDFSAHSQAALLHAAHLADCLDVPLAVLHVVHDPGEAPGYYRVKGREEQLRRLEDVAGDLLGEFMDRMVTENPEHPALRKATRLLVTGLPASRILEVAETVEPKMVVMGSAGRTALSRFLLGSKSEHVLRLCPFPVTIVKSAKSE